jgi:hypothetical protein
MLLAWQQHPERFRPTGPAIGALPNAVYINKPDDQTHDAETPANVATNQCLTNA